MEYKLISLTYKVLTTTQPPYLHNLISVPLPRSTRSSSVVLVSRYSCLATDIHFLDSVCQWPSKSRPND